MSAGDFSEAVQQEIGHFTETTGIRCETDLDALLDISPHFREHALRMFTEGLHNVTRHAQVHQVWVRTVRAHPTNIYTKLGVDSRTSAVAVALELGLLLRQRGHEDHDE